MRTEQEMMDLILNIAQQDSRIRIITLEGSRTNINIPKDEFQDYDVTYFVTDMEAFISNIGVRLQIQLNEGKVSNCNIWRIPSCKKCQAINS